MNKRNLLLGFWFAAICIFVGCKEDIDMSDRYVFEKETITSYLEKHSEYSEYLHLLEQVPVSKLSKTNVRSLLSARGNYTVFAPNNDAIHAYLDSLVARKLITEPSWEAFTDSTMLDSIRRVIVLNSILDGGDRDESGGGETYETSSFPSANEEIPTPTLSDHKLTVQYSKLNPDSIWIDKEVLLSMKNRDIPAINGVIHQTHGVIAPANQSLWEFLKNQLQGQREGYRVAAMMVEACGLNDTLNKIRDERYHEYYLRGLITDLDNHPTEGSKGYIPQHRKYGFTLFAETDEFWAEEIGKEPEDITLQDIRHYLREKGIYPDATDDENYHSEDNLINQFITYHLLPERLPVDKLVIHYNEKEYDPKTAVPGVCMYELYTTMGKRRLLKIFESRESKGVYLNRFPNIKNKRRESYHERSCDADKRGIFVDRDHADLTPINAVVYPLHSLLAYTEDTRNNLGRQRLRFDVSSLFPEFINNDIRGQVLTSARYLTVGIPSDNEYKYFNDMQILQGTKFYYLSGRGKGWPNYLGDEFNVIGRYDIIMRLPPVPKRGTYELRIANSTGVNYRSMCQVYFGETPERMRAMGTPLDFRLNGLYIITAAGNLPSPAGWEPDTQDDDYNAEVDKKMRNNGFMKGLRLYCAGSPGTSNSGRDSYYLTRRIMMTSVLDPNKTYYIRFKNVLDFEDKQLYLDFIEFCPKEVYDNPYEPEDIW